MDNKLIYEFSSQKTDGDASLNNLLGGKGAKLAAAQAEIIKKY